MSVSTKKLTVTIPRDTLKAALLFAGDGDIRGYMNGVLIEHRAAQVRLVSTDGHRLLCVNLHTDGGQNDDGTSAEFAEPAVRYVIDRATIKQAIAGKGPAVVVRYSQTNRPDAEQPGVTVVECAVITVDNITTTDVQDKFGRFPDYERVIPGEVSGKFVETYKGRTERVSYNPEYVLDVTKAKRLLLGAKAASAAELVPNGPRAALAILSDNAIAAVMPMRAEPEPTLTAPSWFTGKPDAAEPAPESADEPKAA